MTLLLKMSPSLFLRSRLWYVSASTTLLFLLFVLGSLIPSSNSRQARQIPFDSPPTLSFNKNTTLEAIRTVSNYFQAYRLNETKFGELGSRLQILREWISLADLLPAGSSEAESLLFEIEKYALSEFPFLRNPRKNDPYPLGSLRKRFNPGSKGIVIAAGKRNLRFCCHLISCLRNVHHSNLPIQVAYAGDGDLPSKYRNVIESIGPNVETMDVLDLFDDETLDLVHGGWAIKPFAMLASKFEQTVLIDADAVFVQPPEVILDTHTEYHQYGALFFHDRLMWKGAYKERHEFWEHEMKHHVPSETLGKSKVYVEGYAEEADSGVVVIDKGRLPLLVGLLHVCWQNMKLVRDRVTYRRGYGDKETWWFGLELSGAPYTFENHYGAVIGEERMVDGVPKVCGFTIAHVGQQEKLLWYNGSLLKNKAMNKTEFSVPTHWMIDGTWEKGILRTDMSCMRDSGARQLEKREHDILRRSVEVARAVESSIDRLFGITGGR